MKARSFALALIAIAAALLAGTMAANVALDLEAVFGTLPNAPRVNANSRYQRYVEYRDAREHPTA